MWFKRRKKSDQDHALSESLRSLQSLLSESGRREPQIDIVDDSEDGAGGKSGSREPELAGGAGPWSEGERDVAEPTPAEPGNRWRELSLSFDAEPLIPKAIEPVSTDDSEARDDPLEVAQTDAPWDEDDGDTEPAIEAAPALSSGDGMEAPEAPLQSQEADQERDQAGVEPLIGAPSSLGSGDDTGAADNPLEIREADSGYERDGDGDEDEAVPGEPAEPILRPPGPPGDTPHLELELHSLDTDDYDYDDEPALPDSESVERTDPVDEDTAADEGADSEAAPEPEPSSAVADSAAAAKAQRLEDQLHLQLEPTDQPADADIPTLTQAIYVPDAPLNAPDAAAVEPAPDTSLAEDIETLRSRLRDVDLEALPSEQQAKLRKGLRELLDKLK